MIDETDKLILPDIVTLEDFGGNFSQYINAVYEFFKSDFVINKPKYRGTDLRLKCHPYIDGREYTFYHFTHDGDIESNRIPNLRRMERIVFPKPLIDNSTNPYLKVWRNKRGNSERILIFHEDESYLVVLEDRGKYILPWTAYLVEYENRKRKLMVEYQNYIKTKTAQLD